MSEDKQLHFQIDDEDLDRVFKEAAKRTDSEIKVCVLSIKSIGALS